MAGAREDTGALVLFSGGQDSTTCLAWALDRFPHVETLGFDYGQRHRVELDCRAALREGLKTINTAWWRRLGRDHTLSLDALGAVSETALTRDTEITLEAGGLPNTFVPGRNIVFLTFAAALAYRRGLRHIVGGMCETDYSGYPDCRDDTIKALQVALNLGMERRFVLHTPLMWIDKAATWRMAQGLGGKALVDLIVADTHTCYLGERGQRHAWGYRLRHLPGLRVARQGLCGLCRRIGLKPGLQRRQNALETAWAVEQALGDERALECRHDHPGLRAGLDPEADAAIRLAAAQGLLDPGDVAGKERADIRAQALGQTVALRGEGRAETAEPLLRSAEIQPSHRR